MKTLKTLAIFCLSAMMFACAAPDAGDGNGNGDNNGGNTGNTKGLVLTADKYEVYPGEVVTFTVQYNGAVLTDGYDICDQNDNELEGNTFEAKEAGDFSFYAVIGAELSADVKITVYPTPPDAPDAPADTEPNNRDFKRRVMLIQFTGTSCQYCPYMVNSLYDLYHAQNKETQEYIYRDKYILTAAHIGPYSGNDPARLEGEGVTIDDALGVEGYPALIIDMVKTPISYDYSAIKAALINAYNRVEAKGGIAVNSLYDAASKYVVLKAAVKAKETTAFRIGACLLEDGISGNQSINSEIPLKKPEEINYHTHNNCIRAFRAIRGDNDLDFSGYELGTMVDGEIKEMEFAFMLKSKWNVEKLRLVVYISTKESDGVWRVNNVVEAEINKEVPFEYIKK